MTLTNFSSHSVGEMRSHLQNIKHEAVKVKRNQDLLDKCKIVSNKLGFVVSAVDVIAEVCPFPSKMPGSTDITAFLGSPICQDCLERDLVYYESNLIKTSWTCLPKLKLHLI